MTVRNNSLRRLTWTAAFTALVCVATMVIQVPVPATAGYINVGDTMIFVAALLLGPRAGLVAGGFGSALADVLAGYGQWAPWTLVIKGLEGLIAGAIAHRAYRRGGALQPASLAGMIVAAGWMVAGYYLAGGLMKGFAASALEIPGNLVQGFGSVVLATPLLSALRRLAAGGAFGGGNGS
jgi:uncharacterized membrane protein